MQKAALLKGIVPEITATSTNFYKYPYVEGELYTDLANKHNIKDLLDWLNKTLWQPIALNDVEKKRFSEASHDFYHTKTVDRIKKFLTQNNITDKEEIINGLKTPKVLDMVEMLDWENLTNGVPVKFHGDLHFDNIIKTPNSYTLLDWRQSFGEIIEYGDIYYDLAKLNHGLIVSHDIVKENLFSTETRQNQINCDIHRHHRIVECQQEFYKFIEDNNFDRNKVDILTYLIYLNIAALHHYPYNIFLYYFGKYGLANCVKSAL